MYLSESHSPSGIYAKCVAASIYKRYAPPIYTLELRAPKFLDAQFEKHRMLSSNSSSSRAIPTSTLIGQVSTDPWIPFSWRKNERGMQGYEELDPFKAKNATQIWLRASECALEFAEALSKGLGVHKQDANRLLDCFVWQYKVVTATEWENFFSLRLADDAQPAIQALAQCMKEAIKEAVPAHLSLDEWHLPYVTAEERETLLLDDQKAVSVARCARASYNRLGVRSELDVDRERFTSLMEDRHYTPFEHQAKPIDDSSKIPPGVTHLRLSDNTLWSANFRGWIQYRQLV